MFLKGYPSEAKIAPKEMRVSNLNRRKLVQSAYTPSSQAKGTKSTSFLAYGTKWTYCPASQEWQWLHVLFINLQGNKNRYITWVLILSIHKWYIDSRKLKWNVQVNVLLTNCKRNSTSLSLLVGTAVVFLACEDVHTFQIENTIYIVFAGLVSGIVMSVVGVCITTIAGSLLMTVGMVTSGLVTNPYLLYLTYGVTAGMVNIRPKCPLLARPKWDSVW